SETPWRCWFSDESSSLTPLIWNVAPRVPVPLKLIDKPDEAVGLFWPLVGFSWKPAKISASDRKLPGLSGGSAATLSAINAPVTSSLILLIGGAAPSTGSLSSRLLGFI